MSNCNTHKKIKKSIKDHRCEHCRLLIPKGSSYSVDSGIFDNDPYTKKQHNECRKEYIKYNHNSQDYEWSELIDADDFDFKAHKEKIKKAYNIE